MSTGAKNKSKAEIRICGFGGQGVIMSGYILGRAAAIFDTKNAVMTQSFGPEARGGAASCDVIISEDKIFYPYLTRPEILVVMSQEAYEKFESQLHENGILIVEEDLVKVSRPRSGVRVFTCPNTRLAQELGARVTLNVVMMGFFTAVTGLLSKEAMVESVKASVPSRALEVNLKAFETGYQYGMRQAT
ncbi:MAG: 2-oxoacid:acceptor oxidoreductase family protein [Chloroflexota bacterium]